MSVRVPRAMIKFFSRLFIPTGNKRLNELVGFLLFVSAILLLLALASYSPLDPSFNTASTASAAHPAQNWIGLAGALLADVLFQYIGISVFLVPVYFGMFGQRWFRSRKVESPGAKTLGAACLLFFASALMALLPWHWNWQHATPIEGLMGRISGDAMIHYFNVTGAYIVCLAAIAVALYLCTAFSFGALRLWTETRFSFVFAAWERFQDWRITRAKAKAERAARKAKEEQQKPVVTGTLVPTKPRPVTPTVQPPVAVKSGIERMMDDEREVTNPQPPAPIEARAEDVAVTSRADAESRPKTIMPKMQGSYKLPSSALLHRADERNEFDEEELKRLAQILTEKCAEFGVHGQVTQINPGPVVTTFEFKPEAGIKYSRVVSLQDDLCLALKAESVLIERMAGKSTVGIQVPNENRETIWLREVVEAPEFHGNKSKLTMALGKDINGRIQTAELNAMPHLLIAGSTGSGKSVAINAFIMSILYKATPDQVRLILVDPKRLELGNYEGVPHLYTPIITEPKLASNALRNAVREMERRLKVLAEKGVRNIMQYNELFDSGSTPSLFDDGTEEKPLPYIVIIIDELADLMMLDGSNVEESITRLAQMARAVGIHLVLATQRPSVDVITGLIKANFPSRMSFRVATKIDSRTILDANGAEALLGRGDMLYLPNGSSRLHRVHAPFVTEKEIAAVVEFWKKQSLAQYDEAFLQAPKDEGNSVRGEAGEGGGGDGEEGDELYQDAVRVVLESGKASTSLLQRRLRIGYGRAAHLIDLMEQDGIVGAADGPRPREVLKRPDWLAEVEDSLR
jgi:S-DNA-T family DNA segregation ATPase FtsK/SpoIIIE